MWNTPSVKPKFSLSMLRVRATTCATGPWAATLCAACIWVAHLSTGNVAMAGDCGCETGCAEPACGFEEPACGFEEPACGFEEPACGSESIACHCGEPTCGFDEPACGLEEPGCGVEPGCDGACGSRKGNLVYRSLDAVAGGIEKLFGLDQCRDNDACGCGCHSSCHATSYDPSLPPTSYTPAPHPSHHHPVPPPVVMPQSKHAGPMHQHSHKPTMTQPTMTRPRLVPTPARPLVTPLSDPTLRSAPSASPATPAVPAPMSDRNTSDTPNPFLDDEVHVRRVPLIQTSAYHQPSDKAAQSSSRRVAMPKRGSDSFSTSDRKSSRRNASR